MNSIKLEYNENGIILKILPASEADSVLNFYEKNSDSFDFFETDKPDNFYTPDYQKKLLQAEYDGFLRGTHMRYFMYDERFPEDIIGTISFFFLRTGCFRQCCTGYKIDKEYRCLGYGTRMLSLGTRIMTRDFNLHRIEAYILPSNTPSVRLARKCGYVHEGIAKGYVYMHGQWTDHLRYVYIS